MSLYAKPLCPYCSEPWTDEMIRLEVDEYGGLCPSCGPESPDIILEIICSKCKKLIYKKEGKGYDF